MAFYCTAWAEQGLGLAYVMEPLVKEQLGKGTLRRVLEPYATSVPGFFSTIRAARQSSAPLRPLRRDGSRAQRRSVQPQSRGLKPEFRASLRADC